MGNQSQEGRDRLAEVPCTSLFDGRTGSSTCYGDKKEGLDGKGRRESFKRDVGGCFWRNLPLKMRNGQRSERTDRF